MSLSWSSVLLVGLALAWGLLFALITLVIGEDLNWLPLNDIEGLAPLILLPILTGGYCFPSSDSLSALGHAGGTFGWLKPTIAYT